MQAQPIAIHGHGILPGLLAVHLLARVPTASLLILSSDTKLGGSHLEPVVASELSAVSRQLVEPFVVSSWPAYYLVTSGKTELQEEEVLLLDPLQVWLELQGHPAVAALVAPCGDLRVAGSRVEWQGGAAEVDRLIDLDRLVAGGGESEIVGMDAARQLTLPVLADYDAGDGGWLAHQYLPLGDERLVVRKLPRAARLIGSQSSFEALLNSLTAA